jgi:hypothetical protein
MADRVAAADNGGTVLTTDYETTAWLRFYEPRLKVVQVSEIYRYPTSPIASRYSGRVLYVVEKKRDQNPALHAYFSAVQWAAQLPMTHDGAELSDYEIWALTGQKAPAPGKMP